MNGRENGADGSLKKRYKIKAGMGGLIFKSAIAAYCFFEKKPVIDVSFVNDGQLILF